jgi:hypothetical protein
MLQVFAQVISKFSVSNIIHYDIVAISAVGYFNYVILLKNKVNHNFEFSLYKDLYLFNLEI